MKIKEAIDRLYVHKAYVGQHGVYTKEAIDMAIKALEKHIPKEPIWEGDGYADGEMVYDTWRCPECNLPYEQDQIHNYCPHCGQKILWWEED